jgi:type VI secretion system protein ImpL
MFALFKRRAFLVFLGVLLIALLIWLAGPYFAFADVKPLESAEARLIAILAVVALWIVWALVKRLRAGRAGAKLAQAVAGKPQAAAPGGAREAVQLRERFEEAVKVLQSKQGGAGNLYELPWYVIIGPPGSGKTTALVNSGLHFPLEQRFGKEAVRGVGGTRNCDWWFTDEAVLLDTAGRYTTQDSDESADSAGWGEFLALLRKYRQRRPLNGVIIALSSSDLMTLAPSEREAHVEAVRRRLEELNRHLRVNLPVYLMVTKCDLIAGFNEYFDDLQAEGRAQVWGVTFPIEKTQAGTAAADFPAQFDALIERLSTRLFGRLDEERDVRRRTALFAFPQQVAGLRDLIAHFCDAVFSSTRYDGRVWLRGVYLTSGTQEGTPIDRLMAAIGRGYGLATQAVPSNSSGRGKAFFIERLLREVIFAEAGLAGVNRRLELTKAAAQLGVYIGIAALTLLLVLAFWISYSRNVSYLADVSSALEQLKTQTLPSAEQSLPQVALGFDALQKLATVAQRYRGNVPWSMRSGLYQGGGIGDEAHDAYLRSLNDVLLPKVGDELRQRLQSSATDADQLFEYLKAYLMLGQPEHLDKTQLMFVAKLDWQQSQGSRPDVQSSLAAHLQNLLDNQDKLRALLLDQTLILQARNAIRQVSLPRIMYSRLKLNYADDAARNLRIDIAAGVGAERVLTRRSGKSLAEPVPAIYTRAVFNEIAGLGTVELIKQFSSDSWVMGDSALNIQDQLRMTQQVMDVYEDDYIHAWDALLNDIQIVPLQSMQQTADALAILAGPASPLRGWLVTVEDNTNLSKPVADAASKAVGAVAAAAKKVQNSLGKVFGAAPAAPTQAPGAKVTAHFAPVQRLVAGPPGGAPIDGTLAKIGVLQQQLKSIGTGVGEISPAAALAKAGGGEAVKSLQLDASLLPPPINALVAQVAGHSEVLTVGQARGDLDQRYREQVVRECSEVVSGRYPFARASGVDVPLADFGRLFGPGGVFDGFFKDNLSPLVDTSRTPWSWRAGATAAGSATMLHQFEQAQAIRDNYFRPGAQLPELHFNVSPDDLDSAATRVLLEFDGQSIDYRHGPSRSVPVAWPGPSPGVAAVTFEDRSSARPNLAFQGPWAFFRLLDAAQMHAETDVHYTATFQTGGHSARFVIEANSIRNPFLKADLQQFRCGG